MNFYSLISLPLVPHLSLLLLLLLKYHIFHLCNPQFLRMPPVQMLKPTTSSIIISPILPTTMISSMNLSVLLMIQQSLHNFCSLQTLAIIQWPLEQRMGFSNQKFSLLPLNLLLLKRL